MAKFICPDCSQPTYRAGNMVSRMGGTQLGRCLPCAKEREKTLLKISGAHFAHASVHKAIKRGELQPAWTMGCHDCGKQACDWDHRDYNRPLDVTPVCRSCNKKRGAAIWKSAPVDAALSVKPVH